MVTNWPRSELECLVLQSGTARVVPVWYDIPPLYSHPRVKISLRYLHPPYDIFTPLPIKAIYDRHIIYNCWGALSPYVYPQCTEAASLVSFALSHPFVICHQLNMTLYCASITTVHAFPFRVASMPAVRYDLSGGLPTCLWLFIYRDSIVICISKKLM